MDDKDKIKYDEFDLRDAHNEGYDKGYDEGWDDGYITAISHMKSYMKNLMDKCYDKSNNPHKYYPSFIDEKMYKNMKGKLNEAD